VLETLPLTRLLLLLSLLELLDMRMGKERRVRRGEGECMRGGRRIIRREI
jgi:hypothetical protein